MHCNKTIGTVIDDRRKGVTLAIKLTTTKAEAELNGVKMLVYGRAGMGKTFLCSTAPKPVIISAEAGLLSLAGFDLPVIKIETIEDLEAAFIEVTTGQAAQFETVCLDSISEIAEVVLSEAKATSSDPRQAYGELTDRVGTLLRKFRDLPEKHVYFSCKETSDKDDNGVIRILPSMPGRQLGPALPYIFDEIMHLHILQCEDGISRRFLRTAPTAFIDAKDRSGQLAELEEPNLTAIIEKIKTGVGIDGTNEPTTV